MYRQDIGGEAAHFKLGHSLSVNRLRVRRSVLRDHALALSEDFPQRTQIVRVRLLEGAPFHKSSGQWSVTRQNGSGHDGPLHTDTSRGLYIPGIFIPASLRMKLPLPICLNIFFIWAYWRSRLLTSCTVVPEPRAMRLRRLPLITSW